MHTSMVGERTSSRRLDFEAANEQQENHGSSVDNELGENQVVNVTSLNNEEMLKNSQLSVPEELIPKIGLEFDTEEDAYQFYKAYAKQVGFGLRRSKSHKDKSGKLIDRIFCCAAEGKRSHDKRDIYVKAPRPETRFGCEAKIKVSSRRTGKFCVVQFVENHNHYLSSPNKTHLHSSHRKITSSAAMQIEMANDVGIRPKASHDLMVRQVGGRENLGFIPQDYRNYLRSKRTRDVRKGDAGGVLEYLHKMQLDDPNFFYSIQVDEDDLITNIFWADAKMRADYSNFGDAVCFDTTYRKNNEGRPIALFVGVNHHKQTVVFGAALLYDETSLTFEWLFDTFSKGMCDKKPVTILTDQDAAMAKALTSTWPETNHRLCIWHIYQNAAIHLSGVFSQFKGFAKDFSSCIYEYEEETEFLEAWNHMLVKYGLGDNDWLRRMFGLKEKWSLAYGRKMFCSDMSTTQRSESMNSVLKRYVTYQHKFLEFFNHFQRLLEDRRYKEIYADFKANTSIPCLLYPVEILKHAASIYTPEVFKWFQKEWYRSHDSGVECLENVGSLERYKVTPHKKSYHHTVTFDLSSGKVDCSCRKFEFAGILCSHILKIFTLKSIMKIPSEYILKRWTRKAKFGFFQESSTNTSNLDPKMLRNIRYKELCGLYVQLVTKACETEDGYKFVKDSVLKAFERVDEISQSKESSVHITNLSMQDEELDQFKDDTTRPSNQIGLQIGEKNILQVKGIKTKKKTISGKRLKSGLEKASRRKKVGRGKNQPLPIATHSSPLLSSNTKGVEENSGQNGTSQGVNHVEYANKYQPHGICVETLNVVETHSPCPLPQLFQGTSASSSQQNTIHSSPRFMGMTDLLLAQQPLNFGSLTSDNVNYEAGEGDAIFKDKCGCSFPCLSGVFCRYNEK